MTDNDMIRRGDALALMQRAVDGYGQKMRGATDKKEKRDWQSMLFAAVDIQSAITALPAVTVGVRPLEWDHSNSYCLVAETSLGEYVVQNEQDDGWGLWTPQQEQGDDPVSYHPDAPTAKAAAEAHHDAAIRGELILTPTPILPAVTPAPDAAAIREAALREAVAVVMEECWKDREMKLAKRIEGRILALIPKGGDSRRVYMGQIMAECDCPREAECQAAGRCIAEGRK